MVKTRKELEVGVIMPDEEEYSIAIPEAAPLGVTLIGIFALVQGLWMLFIGIVAGSFTAQFFGVPIANGSVWVQGIILLSGLCFLILGAGLLKGLQWAWRATIIMATFQITMTVFGNLWSDTHLTLDFLPQAVIIWYLFQPAVKTHFNEDVHYVPRDGVIVTVITGALLMLIIHTIAVIRSGGFG